MRKKFYCTLLSASLLSVASCVSTEDFTTTKETNPEKIEVASNLITTADYSVQTVEGYITTVSYKGMLLARTSTPLDIKIPKEAVSRGTEALDVVFSEGIAAQPYSNLWQTVLFEDSKENGDHDYNDIIIHANYQQKNDQFFVSVQPIALGSTKDIKLGFRWIQDGASHEVIVAENCRTGLFGSVPGFINSHKYDEHFNEFAVVKQIKLPNIKSAVTVEWFIVVDKNVIVNAVNDKSALPCLDSNNKPYGYVLTDVNTTNNNKKSNNSLKNIADADGWSAVKPDVSDWASMPTQPVVPKDAIRLGTVKDGEQLVAGKSYVINEGVNIDGNFEGNENTPIYIENKGSLTLKNVFSFDSELPIIVLPGATLNVPGSALNNINITNFGTINCTDDQLFVGKGSTVRTNKNIETNAIIIESGGILYVAGEVKSKSLTIIVDGSKMFANSLTVADETKLVNSSLLFVNGALKVGTLTSLDNSIVYSDCSLIATRKISAKNSSKISVKGYLNSPEMELMSTAPFNIMSNGLIEAEKLSVKNADNSSINVVGPTMGAIIVKDLNVTGSLNFKHLFTGTLVGVAINNLNGAPFAIDNGNIIRPDVNVTFDRNEIYVPKNDCSPGFNEMSYKDNGLCWFAYPKEGIHIDTCYDIDSWENGVFNFGVEEGAKIFDVTNTNPIKGAKLPIYKMTK
ncbi:MAG: hypothetical protein RR442_00510 [Muribaculaceae bacterium]